MFLPYHRYFNATTFSTNDTVRITANDVSQIHVMAVEGLQAMSGDELEYFSQSVETKVRKQYCRCALSTANRLHLHILLTHTRIFIDFSPQPELVPTPTAKPDDLQYVKESEGWIRADWKKITVYGAAVPPLLWHGLDYPFFLAVSSIFLDVASFTALTARTETADVFLSQSVCPGLQFNRISLNDRLTFDQHSLRLLWNQLTTVFPRGDTRHIVFSPQQNGQDSEYYRFENTQGDTWRIVAFPSSKDKNYIYSTVCFSIALGVVAGLWAMSTLNSTVWKEDTQFIAWLNRRVDYGGVQGESFIKSLKSLMFSLWYWEGIPM